MRLEVRNAEVSRVRSTPINGRTPESSCEDELAIDVDITIATADDALRGEIEGFRINACGGASRTH